MSHQRYPSHDAVKEPHSVSLKVLRLSRPSLVAQYPLQPPFAPATSHPPPLAASLAYSPNGAGTISSGDAPSDATTNPTTTTNPAPFVLSPILNLPPSFGSAYVGETFSCTLCANHDIPPTDGSTGGGTTTEKAIRDVRIEAEMKTPSSQTAVKLSLLPDKPPSDSSTGNATGDSGGGAAAAGSGGSGVDLTPGTSLQRILAFDLKEEGNHVLAVTVSYHEASALSGRTRTFRKLYQFVCRASLIVRTKPGALPAAFYYEDTAAASTITTSGGGGGGEEGGGAGGEGAGGQEGRGRKRKRRRWVLEAQLENCSEEGILLEKVGLELEPGLGYEDWNGWADDGEEEQAGDGGDGVGSALRRRKERQRKPVLRPGETEQVCFAIEEDEEDAVSEVEGRVVFGILQIGWRSEMGNRGFLSTGKLGTRLVKPK